MRRIRYAVAMSLDGFIAGPNGEADWIEMDPSVDPRAFFEEFYAQFDIAVMGRRTFELVRGPIGSMRTYVFSRTMSPGPHGKVTVLGEDGMARLAEWRAEDGKDIWIFGGGVLLGSLASAGLVDTIELSVMPVLLGAGQPVVSGNTNRLKLELSSCDRSPAGILTLRYGLASSPLRSEAGPTN